MKALINAAFVHHDVEAKTEIPVTSPSVDVFQKEDAGREKTVPQHGSSAPVSHRVHPPLLDDVPPNPTSKEIPENVLRGVLGD
ncbi:MAG: hypothetical protein AAB869_00330 [Patescibacteria group bacterium]